MRLGQSAFGFTSNCDRYRQTQKSAMTGCKDIAGLPAALVPEGGPPKQSPR